MLEKESIEKKIIERFNKNFDKHSKYFDIKLHVYPELENIIYEINECIILESYRATITLTNHLLERTLKLALIYNETGIGSKPIEKWDEIFSEPNKKYCSMPLGNSIESCKKEKLITESEKVILFDTIRNLMRNGFSHADPSVILKGIPDESPVFEGSLSNPTELKKVNINQKIIPIFQAIQMDSFAKEFGLLYFDFVFNLMKRIDLRLQEKYK